MFSRRVGFDLRTNRLTRRLQELRARNETILDLTESNPTRVSFRYPDTLRQALADPRVLDYTPDPRGFRPAREAVAAYYATRGQQVDPDQLILTCSTSEAYSFLFKLLADPGDEVLVPRPGYPLFDFLSALESLRPVSYSLARHGHRWSLDPETLDRSLGPRARALLLVHPNNPTGSYLRRADWAELGRLAVRRRLSLICDEVFYDFRLDPELSPPDPLEAWPEEVPGFVLNGLSKTAGLPQMKLAWIVVRGRESFRQAALSRLEFISDTYLSPSTPVLLAASSFLDWSAALRRKIRRRLQANLRLLQEELAGSAVDLIPPEGGWNAVLRVPRIASDEELALRLLEQARVLVHPGTYFDFPAEGFLVLSLLPPPDRLRQGLHRLLEFLG